MKDEGWKQIGQRTVVEPVVRAGARALVSYLPLGTLLRVGRSSGPLRLIGAFAIGTLIGAGAILFFGPGSGATRGAIADGLETARERIRRSRSPATRAQRSKAAALATATRDPHDDGHRDGHDDHGRPRRRHVPRA